MNKSFYPKLAWSNIKKNGKIYIPYMFICAVTIGMFYMIMALSTNPGLADMSGGMIMSSILSFGMVITGIFAVILLFYTNSFLVKRRKKEFGLFNILGMEKRHVSKVIFFETFYVAVISIICGLVGGILFSKLAFLLLEKLFDHTITLYFVVAPTNIAITVILFCVIFVLILINSVIQIYKSNPIELLKSGNVGEKEPKAKWIISLLGLVALGFGYYLSITTKNPVAAIQMFFIAVLLVILGTYLLFTSGSISTLKILKNNKGYYYKSKHFISVSGMMYRMKQNAVGLANICILSTMVLVMISTTLSMFIGADDIIKERYPKQFEMDVSYQPGVVEELQNLVQTEVESHHHKITSAESKTSLLVSGDLKGTEITGFENDFSSSNTIMANFMTLDDYNATADTQESLEENEIIVLCENSVFGNHQEVTIFGKPFLVKSEKLGHRGSGIYVGVIETTIVVKDMSVLESIDAAQKEIYEKNSSDIKYTYNWDIEGTDEEILALQTAITEKAKQNPLTENILLDTRAGSWAEFMGLYGGLFFIGIFLGILFIMATILIMYYKQISEGYDDRERFQIMKKVGLSEKEVKKTIHSQVISVFFLPLIAAVIHLAFAFPIILRMLKIFNMTNTMLFVICTLGCILVFSIFYAVVYSLTAKSYYKIVK